MQSCSQKAESRHRDSVMRGGGCVSDQSHQHLFRAEIRAASSCTESCQPVSMVIFKTLMDLLWLCNVFGKKST